MKSIHNMYGNCSAVSLDYGITHEAIAVKEYELRYNEDVQPSGLWLDQSGGLGASPDGLTETAMIEVKCPHSAKDTGLQMKIDEGRFYLSKDVDGQLCLDRTHETGSVYFHQIQGGLYLSGRSMCHLVVWSPIDMCVVAVPKDPCWGSNLKLLRRFHREHVRPTLPMNRVHLCVLRRN